MLPLSRHVPLLVVAVALASAAAMPASAQDARREGRAEPRLPPVQGVESPRPTSSLSDSVRRVQRETGGRILGAERVPYDGRDINRVKYMDERGRVRYMDDEARPPRDGGLNRGDRPARGDNH